MKKSPMSGHLFQSSDYVNIGDAIIEEIVHQGMIQAEDMGDCMLFIWNGNAAEQLEALVHERYAPMISALEEFLCSNNKESRRRASIAAKEALGKL